MAELLLACETFDGRRQPAAVGKRRRRAAALAVGLALAAWYGSDEWLPVSHRLDPEGPWTVELGRGSGWHGLDTVRVSSDGSAVLHRLNHASRRTDDPYWETTEVELPQAARADVLASVERNRLLGRGKASDAKTYKRSPTSCTTYLRCLRSLWKKHLKPLGHVKENPWLDVPYPNAPRGKRVRVPAEETVAAFLTWLEKKHTGWELPRLFVQVKMLSGCRTLDLCKVKSSDLGDETLTLAAEATKTREARTVPLPAEVVKALRQAAGATWLWERSLEESKQYRPNARTRDVTEYKPTTWNWTIQNLFREFNQGRDAKARLRPHDLRARAITVVATATQNVDATAQAMGVDPQTARYYLDASKAFDRSEILKKAADLLLPPGEGPNPSEK